MPSADDEDQITVRYIREHQGTSIGTETRGSSRSARSLLEAGIAVDARVWHAARAAAFSAESRAIEIDPAAMLADNFVRAVIADPKVQAVGAWACLEAPRFRPVFERGVYPEAIDCGLRKWPVVLDPDRLTAQFRLGGTSGNATSNPFGDRSFWERRPTPVNEEAAGLVVSAIVDRHQQFFAPLRDGRLILEGVFRATGMLQQVEPRSLDARKWIDLDDNGLYELEPDGTFRHVWEGLTIRSAGGAGASAVTTEAGHVIAPEVAPLTSFLDPSELSRSECKVRRAAMVVYPSGIPAELSFKQLCRELQPRVMHMGFGAVSESTIKRYIWKYRRRNSVKNIRSTHQT
jgi:hypothetical protein